MNELSNLNNLAFEINTLHEQAESYANQAVVYAAKCGAKLIEAKEQCAHGEWLPWLEANCRVKQSQAKNYIRVAKEYPQLLDSNRQLTGVFPGIEQAISLLSAPDEVKEAVQEKLDAGEHVTVKEIEELKRKLKEEQAARIQHQGKAQGLESVIKTLEIKLNEKPKETIIERQVIPEDYQALKLRSKDLDQQTKSLSAEVESMKSRLKSDVEKGIKTYLSSRQSELDAMEHRLNLMRAEAEKCREEVVSANQRDQELKAQVAAIQEANFALNKLAVSLSAFEHDPDGSILRQWQMLAQSLSDGSSTIKQFLSLKISAA